MNDAKINNNVYKASSEYTTTGALQVQIGYQLSKEWARQIFKNVIKPFTKTGDIHSDQWITNKLTDEILKLGSGTLIVETHPISSDVVTFSEDDEEE